MLRIFGKTVAVCFGILAVALPAYAASGSFTAKPYSYTAAADTIGGGTVYFSNLNQNMTLCTGSYVPL
jgi:hypothetical protein